MSSHNRKPSRAAHLALATALLVGSAAHAAEESHSFVLTAFSNGAVGHMLIAGDYNAAVQQLDSNPHSPAIVDPESRATNSCVAYAVTKQLAAAHVACNKAIREAQQEMLTLPVTMSWARREYKDYLAIAYSNRAVLNWLSNDTNAAQEDLKKAKNVAPKADFVVHNQSALLDRNTLAQVMVAPNR